MYILRVLIGSLHSLLFLRLARVVKLVLVFRHLIENRSNCGENNLLVPGTNIIPNSI